MPLSKGSIDIINELVSQITLKGNDPNLAEKVSKLETLKREIAELAEKANGEPNELSQ